MEISLKVALKGPIDKKLALVSVMVWHRLGDKPLLEPMMTSSLMQISITRGPF